MSENLKLLADKLGIATSFSDAGMCKRDYNVSDETIRFFINALGYKCENEEDILNSLALLESNDFSQVLKSIYVCRQENIVFDVVIPKNMEVSKITIKDSAHNIKVVDIKADNENIYWQDKKKITYRIASLDIGYYDISVMVGNKNYKSILAVAPKHCYDIPLQNNKLWGYGVQLYAVKSKRNWGVGDFTDLAEIVRMSSRCGADIIGLNPLNILCHDYPENASPYQSISRLFLNPIYIDVEKVPEYDSNDKKIIEDILNKIKQEEYIQYGKVYNLKINILEKCFERFMAKNKPNRQKAYKKFCEKQGKELERLALFQALSETKTLENWGSWDYWPEIYNSPTGVGILDYLDKHGSRVEFFKFLQFEAYRQFDTVKKTIDECGLKIGLYRDLAVGVGRNSAEYWGGAELFIKDASVGAPPDAFFPCGQRWGVGAFLPSKLKETGYEPFIRVLRANMQNAGALRIDHVMSLMRLYVLPETSEQGTYLYYNFADMLNILAIESHLNKCVIVGESIGNVPDGFLDTLKERNILSLSVLWSERDNAGWGGFYAPCHYNPNAVASIGTHDMPPLKMWWFGYDIELAHNLGMISEDEKINSYHKREADRKMLLSSLDAAAVWPEDKTRHGDYLYGEAYPEGIEEAVHRYVAKSASKIFLAQLEDFLHVAKQQNLPGTDRDRHPNWRLKLPVDLENLEDDIAYIRNVAAIRKER